MKNSIPFLLLFSFTVLMFSACDRTQKDNILSSISTDNTRLLSFQEELPLQKKSRARKVAPVLVIPLDAINMVEANYEAYKAKDNTSYFIPAGYTWTSPIQLRKNTNYYVQGSMKLDAYGSGGQIFVLPEGTLELPEHLASVDLTNLGNLIFPESFSSAPSTSFKTYQKDLTAQRISFSGDVEIEGNLSASYLSFNGNKNKALFHGNLDIHEKLDLTNGGNVLISGTFTAKNVEINSSAVLELSSCGTIAENTVITNNSSLIVSSYFRTKNTNLSSSAKVFLNDDVIFSCQESIELNNPNNKFYNVGTKYALIQCGTLVIHQDVIDRLSGGPIDLHASEIKNATGKDLCWTSNVIFKGSTYIAENDCKPQFGEKPTVEEEYVLNHIAHVLSPDSRKISATSIAIDGNKSYVSWHEYGEPYQGYIDELNITSRRIEATLYSSVLDFNHAHMSNGNILIAGGRTQGAFYGEIKPSTAVGELDIDIHDVEGTSGNCVLSKQDKIWVASGSKGGISIFSPYQYIALPEAKYIINYGSSMAVMAGIEETKIYFYSKEGDLQKSFSVGNIQPKDGKNTMVSDANSLFVALGKNGVRSFENGVEKAVYTPTEKGEAANCVEVDENFVYVANGPEGLYILNKEDLSILKKYTLGGGASANFVKKGSDGYIYVAYGTNGIHVFRLDKI